MEHQVTLRNSRVAVAWRWIMASLMMGLVSASRVDACAVCFGKSDDPIVQGVEASVLFMVVLTYLLIMGGAVVFFVLRHRSRQKQRRASAPTTS